MARRGGGREGGTNSGGGRNPGRSGKNGGAKRARNNRIDLAVTGLTNALMEKGLDSNSALRFARMALTQKGVTIGRNGFIRYQGSRYSGADFANTPLANYITGAKAKALNEAKIKNDPNYQAAIAQLALTQQQGQAGLDAQRRSALLDFGDASYVQGDPTLAAAVAANPFSTSRLIQQQYGRDQAAAQQSANRAGTLYGGGAVSGALGAQHVFAGNEANATTALQNLLGSLGQQGTALSQNQTIGGQQALLQTQQNLAQEGVLSASAPRYHVGAFNLFHNARAEGQRRRRLSPAPPPSPF
jgi:hypothetical protein